MGRLRFDRLFSVKKHVDFERQLWLPDEIWEHLLLKLNDSEDIGNFCKAYSYFDDLLHSAKNRWLFDKVFLLICSYLSISDVLNCRLVCKKWQYGIEKFMKNQHLYMFPCCNGYHHIPFEKRKIHRWIHKTRPFQIRSNASQIESVPDGLSKINCAGTYLELSIPQFESSSSFQDKLIKVAAIFSSIEKTAILHLKLRLSGYEVSCEELIELLSNCFSYCKCLRSLIILQSMVIKRHDTSTLTTDKYTQESIFSSLRKVWPASLEFLSVDLKADYENLLNQALFQLCISNKYSVNSLHLPIPHFKELFITNDIITLSLDITSDSQLSSLQNITLPLTQLSITVDLYSIRNLPEFMNQLVLQLENFRSTLTCLSISMFSAFYSTNDSEDMGFDIAQLQLPKLKELILTEIPVISWNMFTSLKSLEYFTLHSNGSPKSPELTSGPQEILNLRNYLSSASDKRPNICRTPYCSNIWNVFPKLREFVYVNEQNLNGNDQRYRRDTHEAHLIGFHKFVS